MDVQPKQFVYKGKMVRKTGRTATKQIKDKPNRRSTIEQASPPIVYEIEPSEGDIEWKEWVSDTELYVIND